MLRTGHKADKLRVADNSKLPLAAEPTRHSGAERHAANDLSCPCRGCCSRWIAGGTQMEKVTGIGGFFFRAKDPKALGLWYQQHLGGRTHAIELRGFRLTARAGPPVFDPQPETSDYFGDTQKVWMLNFRGSGSRQNGGPAASRWNRGRDGPAVLS